MSGNLESSTSITSGTTALTCSYTATVAEQGYRLNHTRRSRPTWNSTSTISSSHYTRTRTKPESPLKMTPGQSHHNDHHQHHQQQEQQQDQQDVGSGVGVVGVSAVSGMAAKELERKERKRRQNTESARRCRERRRVELQSLRKVVRANEKRLNELERIIDDLSVELRSPCGTVSSQVLAKNVSRRWDVEAGFQQHRDNLVDRPSNLFHPTQQARRN